VNRTLVTKTEKTVIIKADRDVDYGSVMEAMDMLRMGGIEDMGLITSSPAKRAQ
jgi:biopolymer transport protein ExbD